MLFRYLVIVVFAFLAGGCAIGTTRLKVEHSPLEKVESKKHGNILVKEFVDNRKEDHEYIGNKRNGFGMVLGHVGTEEGVKLESVLTRYFAEALTEAGYNVVFEKDGNPGQVKVDAVVGGEIVEFWLDLYMKVWHNIEVRTTAMDPDSKKVLWEKNIKADQSNVLWIGATGEFEKVISESVTKALNEALKEYASDSFQKAVAKQGS
jgi:hypothetical protein